MENLVLSLAKADMALPLGFDGFFDAASYKLLVQDFGGPDTNVNLLDNKASFSGDADRVKLVSYVPIRVTTPEGTLVLCQQRASGLYSIGLGTPIVTQGRDDVKLVDHLADVISTELQREVGINLAHHAMVRSINLGHFFFNPTDQQLLICPIIDYPRVFEMKATEGSRLENLHWERLENLHNMADSKLLEPNTERIVRSNLLG